MKTFADNLDVYKILLAAAHINNCVVSAHNYLKTAFKGTLYGNSLSILEFVKLTMCNENSMKLMIINYKRTIFVICDYKKRNSLRSKYLRRRKLIPYYMQHNAKLYRDLRHYMHLVRPFVEKALNIENTQKIKFIGFKEGAALASVLAFDFSVYNINNSIQPKVCLCAIQSSSPGNQALQSAILHAIDHTLSFNVYLQPSKMPWPNAIKYYMDHKICCFCNYNSYDDLDFCFS